MVGPVAGGHGCTNNRLPRITMNDSQILSAFQDLPSGGGPRRVRAPDVLFDACQLGVVLRAVLLVQAVVTSASLFGATGVGDWLARLAVGSVGALAATLAWLLVTCGLKRALARLPPPLQHAAGIGLGAVAGVFG